jgi:arginine decarboxylase
VEMYFVMNQSKLPLLEAINTYRTGERSWLHVPGHGGGPGLPQDIAGFFSGMASLDLTELPGLDDLHHPAGAIAEAQALAAHVWQADETYFLVNGSTSGILSMVLASCQSGDEVLVPRNAHGSFYHALILSGVRPRYLPVMEKEGVSLNVTVQAVREGFARYPAAKAIYITSPGYHGVCADVKAIADVVRRHGALLLLDEAHGAHLGFSGLFPRSYGHLADLRVQSWHKTLGALTPGAVLHRHGNRIESHRLRSALRWFMSSSPSYPVLLSLDAVRQQMALTGKELMERTAQLAGLFRQAAAENFPLLQPSDVQDSGFLLDPTRVTVLTGKAGYCGYFAGCYLHRCGVDVELALPHCLLALVGPGTGESECGRFQAALNRLAGSLAPARSILPNMPEPVVRMTPREAYYAPATNRLPAKSVGCIAADMVVSYPPGNPLLVPGEEVTKEIITYLQEASQAGVRFRGLDLQGRMRICL